MNQEKQIRPLHILLADDDTDDCFFFEKAVKEISPTNKLSIAHDGEKLMDYLNENSSDLPDILFLDLSMPRKTGFECLTEIQENEKLNILPVVMFSTSFSHDISYEQSIITMLNNIGAQKYIRKPSDFIKLKQVIRKTLIEVMASKKVIIDFK